MTPAIEDRKRQLRSMTREQIAAEWQKTSTKSTSASVPVHIMIAEILEREFAKESGTDSTSS